MRLSLFLLAAIVLLVFGIIAGAAGTGTLFTVAWFIWFMAGVLAYLVDIAVGGWGPWNGTVVTARPVAPPQP
jgi:hypothetical protein